MAGKTQNVSVHLFYFVFLRGFNTVQETEGVKVATTLEVREKQEKNSVDDLQTQMNGRPII